MRLLGVLLLSAGLIHAQQTSTAATKSASEKLAELHYVLVPDVSSIVTVKAPSPLRETGAQCLADGSLAMHFMLPPDPKGPSPNAYRHVYDLIAPDGTMHTIDLALVNDLKLRPGQAPLAYDIGERDAVFLYFTQERQRDNAWSTQWHVARFDRQGQYHGAVELNLGNITPQKLAVFDSGDDLVIAGFDSSNQLPILEHYSISAGKATLYVPDSPLAAQTSLERAGVEHLPESTRISLGDDPIKGLKVQTSVQLSQFVHYKDSVLMLTPGSSTPVFKLYADGTVRTLPLPQVAGTAPFQILSTDEGLYLTYSRPLEIEGTTGSVPQFLLEVDLVTGEERRRIDQPAEFEPQCVHQGLFRVLRTRDGTTLEMMNASVRAK